MQLMFLIVAFAARVPMTPEGEPGGAAVTADRKGHVHQLGNKLVECRSEERATVYRGPSSTVGRCPRPDATPRK